jgi:hypothetical protein
MGNPGEAATPADAIALLVDEAGVARACTVVEGWAKSERWNELFALGAELEASCDPGDKARRGYFETLADHVEDQLALGTTDASVDALLALALKPRERSVEVPRPQSVRLRAFASRLGYAQTAETFLAALERAKEGAEYTELFACWMFEIVLRGTSLATDQRAKRFRESLVAAGHPLAGLPLALLATEREAPSYMPLYGEKGLGRAIDALASGPMSVRTIPPPADGAAVRATREDDASLVERMLSAVRPWTEGKNGKAEAKVFALEPPVASGSVGSWLLRALPLESASPSARLDVSRTGPEGVFGPLFSAASNGGAYSSGLGGAYGRLAAWTSLGALVGAGPTADVGTIDKLASTSTFLTFRAPGPWFHDVAWDLGALALRAGGRSVAVLAATDNE